jgi:hypothetical protein
MNNAISRLTKVAFALLATTAGFAAYASNPVADEKIAVAKASIDRAEQSGAPWNSRRRVTNWPVPRRRMPTTTGNLPPCSRIKRTSTPRSRKRWRCRHVQRKPLWNSIRACKCSAKNPTALPNLPNKDIS